jgi:hypothetical protein
MPAGSDFTTAYGVRMNESGTIIGSGAKNGGFHGFMLVPHRPVFDVGRLEPIVAQILTGVINDAGALILLAGSIIPLPPRGPVEAILAALPAHLAQTLTPLVETRPRDAESAGALRRRLAHTIARPGSPRNLRTVAPDAGRFYCAMSMVGSSARSAACISSRPTVRRHCGVGRT